MIHSSKYLILRDLPFLSSLSDMQLEQVVTQAAFVKYKKGDMVYKEGDDISSVYIVHKGDIKSGRQSGNGKILLKEIVYKKELLGENILTAKQSRTEFAQALTDLELFELPVAFFKDLLSKNPQLCQELTLILINKMSNLETRMSNFVFKKAQTRILNFLKKLADAKGIKIGLDEILVNHGLSHKEIANICLLYTSPSPRDRTRSRMPSSA